MINQRQYYKSNTVALENVAEKFGKVRSQGFKAPTPILQLQRTLFLINFEITHNI